MHKNEKKILNLKLFRLIIQIILFINIKYIYNFILSITFILPANSIHKKRENRHKIFLILIIYLKRIIILMILFTKRNKQKKKERIKYP